MNDIGDAGGEFLGTHINWIFYDETNKPVGTFYPEVLKVINVVGANGDIVDRFVRIKLRFQEEEKEVLVRLSELERLDWFELDQRCLVNYQYRKVREYIANVIRNGIEKVPVEVRYKVDRLGIMYIGDRRVFVAGDRVIARSSDINSMPDIDTSAIPFKLDIDTEISVKEAIEGMEELICLNPEVGEVVVAHVISGIIRAAFKEVRFTPSTVLMVVGESGMLKSNYISHLAQLYNRADKIRPNTRLNSTKRFIEDLLYQYRECTAVIDDLHSAESRDIKRINENTAEEIIRRIGDDTGRGYKIGHESVQNDFMGNVVFMGEYITGKKSTLPRMLVVEITKKSGGEILDKYQRHKPLLVSTFYYFFIQWYVDHFEDIRDGIDRGLTSFREASKNSNLHGRLQDTQFYLKISYMSFLEFCKDSGYISKEESRSKYDRFCLQLRGLIQAQYARFMQDNEGTENKDMDCLKIIRELYKSNRFCLAKSISRFNPQKHDGLVYDNYKSLCLRGECIDRIAEENFSRISKKQIIQILKEKNALKLVAEKNTVQIEGKRFYAIKLSALK